MECTPTQPRPENAQPAAPLRKIQRGAGKGQYLLPVSQTAKPVDLDLLNNTLRLPYRERLAIILNELGTGLAGRGGDLRQAVTNADPALKETDKVLAILADQNRVLSDLARNGDTILAPLARDRAKVADFVTQANKTSEATAERSSALEQNVAKLPAFLRELKPTMERLGGLSDQMTPVLTDLGAQAPAINRFIKQLGPFSQAGIPALQSLGAAADVGAPALTKSKPIITDVGQLASTSKPLTNNLAALLTSLQGHRRHRAPDGLPLLPGGRHQRLRCRRALPARGPDPQRLLAVRDRGLAGLPGHVPQLRQRERPRGGGDLGPGLRRHAALGLAAPARCLLPRQDAGPRRRRAVLRQEQREGRHRLRGHGRRARAAARGRAATPAPAAAPSQPQASGNDPSSALLDYLLGGGG